MNRSRRMPRAHSELVRKCSDPHGGAYPFFRRGRCWRERLNDSTGKRPLADEQAVKGCHWKHYYSV